MATGGVRLDRPGWLYAPTVLLDVDQNREVAPLLADADGTDDAIQRIAPLPGVGEIRVLVRLSRFSLFSLTRGAREARARTLDELRRESP